jgi:hypothetical protein
LSLTYGPLMMIAGARVFGGLLTLALLMGGCAIQRSQDATDAKQKLVGFTKEQILICMGPPANKANEGNTEVWSYNSGDGRNTIVTSGSANTDISFSGDRRSVSGTAHTNSSELSISRRRFCVVNVIINSGRVTAINYVGPSGGLLSAGEQCAFALQNCLR